MTDYKRLIQHDELEMANDLLDSKEDENIVLIWFDDHIDDEIKDLMIRTNYGDKNNNVVCYDRQHVIVLIKMNKKKSY
ncbi:unnamed protein product [Didymodactylos carnosus]|uniref:Uncharacterized protein n=1 Tax=Didymodactylos carnosus TaxID=1234261 RepID=A0A814LQV9_9BILA|nr:unnamed protein product [Didymodactylos carnosus]CAF1066564.1 unnamed protein product [Didymodactylos carnosus]CAF3663451.1 unnamed protein product [Didymodactylos carnosus]CAF3834167.1 unnamed protein product [Didymodactylos carnosus]